MKTVLIIFGTRPEAIKMVSVLKALEQYPQQLKVKVCITAQHRQMLDQVLEVFKVTPEYDLDLMKPNQDLYDITSRVIYELRAVLDDCKPDAVLVHGDTTTTFAAALAAFYRKIPVGHVEAGLRTGDIYAPWPEEMNRKLTDAIATWYYAPTTMSSDNLLRENVNGEQVIITGNTVIDTLHLALDMIDNEPQMEEQIQKNLDDAGYLPQSAKPFILVTGHRRENFGQGFINICGSLKTIAQKYPDYDIVYPVHLNPNVQEPVNKILQSVSNVILTRPLDYMPFIYLMDQSYLILTDSGGIQEEGPSLGKPIIVMRETTERPEAVNAGTVKLVGTDPEKIIGAVSELIDDPAAYEKMSRAHNPYGDGKAGDRIARHLLEHLH